MGAVAQKLEAADRTKNISTSIKKSVPIIQRGLRQMEKIGIDKAVAEFDQVFEDLDVKADAMNEGLNGVYSSTVDQGSVENLMKQLQESQAVDVEGNIGNAPQSSLAGAGKQQNKNEDDDLMARLRNLQD